jgi:hypothetical protein
VNNPATVFKMKNSIAPKSAGKAFKDTICVSFLTVKMLLKAFIKLLLLLSMLKDTSPLTHLS